MDPKPITTDEDVVTEIRAIDPPSTPPSSPPVEYGYGAPRTIPELGELLKAADVTSLHISRSGKSMFRVKASQSFSPGRATVAQISSSDLEKAILRTIARLGRHQ